MCVELEVFDRLFSSIFISPKLQEVITKIPRWDGENGEIPAADVRRPWSSSAPAPLDAVLEKIPLHPDEAPIFQP